MASFWYAPIPFPNPNVEFGPGPLTNKTQQIWRNSSNLSRDNEAAQNVELRIQELTSILTDESRRPLPHPCIQFASMKQIYIPIGKIATTSRNEWIVRESVLFFATLIESEEEAFVENGIFSASLTNLIIRITGVNSVGLHPDTETKVVEMAFNVTTKIRLQPVILDAWFSTAGATTTQEGQGQHQLEGRERFEGRTQKQDFPLFYVLMDYIHHEGKIGDFARTGLLYIIEAASASGPLEQWIVESDLSTLMATGLGALYSQLSRKLVIDYLPHEIPPVLAMSDYQHPTSSYEIVSSCSPQFQAHLETFMSHLMFWQDVLNHCRSVEIKSTLLEHFQAIFLQQLLYPSLLESSDIDGGSSVAVITYLRRILESLDHPDMINLILHYLLALPDAPAPEKRSAAISAARKRKSMDLQTMLAETSDLSVTPLLFNLVDLVLACLHSHSQQTIHVTLQLVSTILKRHHRYAVLTLLQTERVPGLAAGRTVGAHSQEVEYLMSLAGSVGGQDNFDEVYENMLKDTTARLESHSCSLKLVAPKVSTNNHKLPAIPDSLPGAPRDVGPHTLRPDDPLLASVLTLLETFFINPVDTNLSVTEAITDLAICGYMAIEGWMLRSPQKYTYDDADPMSPASPTSPTSPGFVSFPIIAIPTDPDSPEFEEYQQLQSRERCRRRPKWESSSLPRFLAILQHLCNQVSRYREIIPRFDDLLQQRREAFQTADSATAQATPVPHSRKQQGAAAPVTATPDRRSMDEYSRSGSPARVGGLEGFAQRLLSELGTPTRSGSPRGRKEPPARPSPGGAAMLGGYGLGTPTAKPIPIPPKEFPLNYENPTRSGLGRSYSPSSAASGRDETASSYGGRDVVASQAAAFAAVHQSILARQVGIPGKVDAIPLKFEKRSVGDASMPLEGSETPRGEGSEDESENPVTPPEQKTVSVSHVITNALILQFFLLELASLVQVRASLFNEVRFI